jgi:hypothetical protein
MNILDRVCKAMEGMLKKSLEDGHTIIANHIKSIFDAEIELQIEELNGKKISLFFDGTPRLGTFLPLLHGMLKFVTGKPTAVNDSSISHLQI